ncbi:MAG TPA: DUF4337 domain-containing protein [Vitreimonas sp.]|nr:DUF4337 domain-containing protein [Vitreimonas sp.]
MADEKEDAAKQATEKFNNLVAATIALLATFTALAAIKGGNVAQNIQQAQVSSNDNWAWYQAVRTREDMATYELLRLNQLQRNHPARAEAARLAREITAQGAELAHIRERKDEVQHDATAADASVASLNVFDNQYDISTGLITIAMSLLAICVLAQTRWLYWFSLAPGGVGLIFGAAAMGGIPINVSLLTKLLT